MKEDIKRIITNDKETYYIYLDGGTHYDENSQGEEISVLNYKVLDSEFNEWYMNIGIESISSRVKELREEGYDVFEGSKSPITESVYGEIVENSRDEKGIWIRTTYEDKLKYISLLNKKANKEHKKKKLLYTELI